MSGHDGYHYERSLAALSARAGEFGEGDMGAVGGVRVLIGFECRCCGGRKSYGGFVVDRDIQV